MTENPQKKFHIASGLLLLAFFLAFALIDGPVWAKDSASYAGMSISREPVYPMFLAVFRKLFGEAPGQNDLPAYLFPAVIAQALVNAYAVWVLVKAVLSAFAADKSKAVFLAALAGDFHLIVSLLNRFIAGRGSMYSEAILTESLAMPLYLLFVVRLWERDNRRLAILSFLLIGLRKQMAVVLILWLAVTFLDALRNRPVCYRRYDTATCRHCPLPCILKRFRGCIITFLTILLILFMNGVFERAYNSVVHHRAVTHTGNGKGMMCTLLYSADPAEDTSLFQTCRTTGMCELFADILTTCDTMGLLKKNLENGTARYYIDAEGQQSGSAEAAFEAARSGETPDKTAVASTDTSLLTLGEHYAASYDIIGYEVCDPMIGAYLAERGITGIDAEIAYDKIATEFNRVLLKQDKGDLLHVFFVNVIKGLAATNARIHPLLIVPSILLYLIYAALYVVLRRRAAKDNAAGDRETVPALTSLSGVLDLAEIVFLGIVINVGVVGLMIFPQPRYMIYSMGLFYTALSLLAYRAVFKQIPYSFRRLE